MSKKQWWSRKEVCELFNKAYNHKEVYKHASQTEGIEILEELFGLDIYDKDYTVWHKPKDIEYPGEEDKFTLAYEKGEWWAVAYGGLLFWKEEVIFMLNHQQDQLDNFENTLKEAIQNERTDMGCNALKQLADKLGIEYV